MCHIYYCQQHIGVTTKSRISTTPTRDTSGNANQAVESTGSVSISISSSKAIYPTKSTLITTTNSAMKSNLDLHHILDIVIDLRPDHCIWSCLAYAGILSIQKLLSLRLEEVIALQYEKDDGALTPIKKHGIELIWSSQSVINFLSTNGAYIYEDWGTLSCDNFTSFQVSTLNNENSTPLVKEMMVSGITIDKLTTLNL